MRSQSHEQFVMSSEVATSRHVPVSCAAGWKAWPRSLRLLRCSLDFVWNDRYEMLRPN